MKIKENNLGFTLLELLVSLAIVSILFQITISEYQAYKERAYLSKSLQLNRNLDTALAVIIDEFPGEYVSCRVVVAGSSGSCLSFNPDMQAMAEDLILPMINYDPMMRGFVRIMPTGYDIYTKHCKDGYSRLFVVGKREVYPNQAGIPLSLGFLIFPVFSCPTTYTKVPSPPYTF